MGYHFFAFLFRMKYINRWGLMRNTKTENLAEHSLEVSVIAHALCVIANEKFGGNFNAERAATLALFHDGCEIITGDLPTPVKYFSAEIKKAYGEVEKVSSNKLLSMLPDDLKPTYEGMFFKKEEDADLWLRIKAADKLSAYIKCLEELKASNHEFSKAAQAIKKTLDGNPLPEVAYFMGYFLESFSLTLDEQE